MTVMDSVSDVAGSLLTLTNSYAASHHDGMVALLIFVGVVVSFSGRTLLKPTVFLLGFIPTTTAIAALGLAFVQDQQLPARPELLDAVAVFIALLFGVLVGVIMLRLLFRIATFVLCAGFGAVLVLVLHLLLLEPAIGPNAQFLWFAAAIFAALIAGLFSVSYPETGIILGTSFDGAALSVFSLAKFLGNRPRVLSTTVQGKNTSPWWAVGYGAATLLLGLFGAMTQRRVANADAIIAAKAKEIKLAKSRTSDAGSAHMLAGEQHLLLPFEPPRTPPHLRSGLASPTGNSNYGAIDHEDSQYSVVRNLGAGPLGSEDDGNLYKTSKDSNGPLPL